MCNAVKKNYINTEPNEKESFDGDQNEQTEESFSETFVIPSLTLNDDGGLQEGKESEHVKSKRECKSSSPNFRAKGKNLDRAKSKRSDTSSGKHFKVDSSSKRKRGRSRPPLFLRKDKSDKHAGCQENKQGIGSENIHWNELSWKQRRNAVCMMLMPAANFRKLSSYLRLLFEISMVFGTDLV